VQERVRTYGIEDESFCAVIAARKPFRGSVAKRNEKLRGFDPVGAILERIEPFNV
jgi:hypothetical protein